MKAKRAKPKSTDIISNVGTSSLSFRKTLRGHAVGPPPNAPYGTQRMGSAEQWSITRTRQTRCSLRISQLLFGICVS